MGTNVRSVVATLVQNIAEHRFAIVSSIASLHSLFHLIYYTAIQFNTPLRLQSLIYLLAERSGGIWFFALEIRGGIQFDIRVGSCYLLILLLGC